MTAPHGRRWVLKTLCAIGVMVSMGGQASPALAVSQPPVAMAVGSDNAPGSQWLASCLAAGRTLSVLFLLDVSGSLKETDPTGSRYDGLRTALSTLANTRPPDGSDVTIEAGVAGFGNRHYSTNEIVPWQRINIDSPESLIDAMTNQARDRTAFLEDGTGFQFVIQPSVDEMIARGGPQSCKAVVWFTDGDPSDPEAVVEMCRPGGAVEQMRANGIVLIGLRLSQNGQPEPTPDMRSMTLGEAGGVTCGTVPIPEDQAPGIYLEAEDVRRLFASIQNITEGCTPTGDLGLRIDPGIRRVRVNLATDRLVDTVRFDLPGGLSFDASTIGSSTPPGGDGIVVSSIRDDFYVSMELVLPAGVGAGDWLISTAGALSQEDIEVCVFSDLRLVLDEDSVRNLKAGSTAALVVNVVDTDGLPADLSVFGTASAGVSLLGPDGQPRTAQATVDPTQNTVDLLVKTKESDARLDLEVSLTLTTASGLELTPLRLQTPVVTALNDYYPKVEPLDELNLGDALREDPVSGNITIAGSERGPTSVCFGPPESIQVPPDAQDADPVYATGCIQLAIGETRSLTVSASTTNPVEGDGSALIPITITAAPDAAGFQGVAELKLPVRWRFSNPLDVGILIWTLVGVILLAITLPLLAILWANWVTARFDVTNLRVAKIPVVVNQTGIWRVAPIENSDALVGTMTRYRPPTARRSVLLWGRDLARRFTIDGVTFRSRASWNPFRPARFWAESSSGQVLISSFGAQTGSDPRPNAAPFSPAFAAAAVWSTSASAISKSDPVEGVLIVLQTSGGRREAKVDAEPMVRGASWSSMLAQYRPTIDLRSAGIKNAGGSTPPPIPRPNSNPKPPRPRK